MLRHRNEFPVEGELPAFDGATAWLNSAPLTPAGLRGQVVLVSFGTYTCINWIRSLPYVRAWADKYAGPRAGGRRRADARVRVRGRPRQRGPRHQGDGRPLPGRGGQRLRRLAGVRQPLLARPVLRRRPGSDPAPPLRRGRVRAIRDGPPDAPAGGRCRRRSGPRALEPDGVEAAADWASLGSPESYLGYERAVDFASPGGACPTSATSTRHRPRCAATSGRCRATGGSAPCLRCSTSPAVPSRTSSTPVTCIS